MAQLAKSWFRLRDINMKPKLITLFLSAAVIPLLVVAWLSYRQASNALEDSQAKAAQSLESQTFAQLVALRDVKEGQISHYFEGCQNNLQTLVDTAGTLHQEAVQKMTGIQDLKKEQIEDYFNDRLRLMNDVQANLRFCKGIEAFAQAFPEGLDSEEYQTALDERHQGLETFLDTYGFYDVFLIDPDGNVIYTVTKESDLGTNLRTGPFKDSGLAKAFKGGKSKTTLVDFAWYEPSKEPAGFLATPLKNTDGKFVGVAAFQLSTDLINHVAQNRIGLSDSAESYLVGELDGKIAYRSDRVVKKGKLGEPKSGEDVERAVAGKSGSLIKMGSTGDLEVALYNGIDIPGLTWGIVTSANVGEIVSHKFSGEDKDFFTKFMGQHGYYDLFLIAPDGYCFYTVFHEPDYQTNLVDGKYKDSNLGRLTREVLQTKTFGFTDFEPYAPSNGAPASFIAQPVLGDRGTVDMIVALQMPLDTINAIMGVRAGMGETGETYLIGPDKRMRSDSFLDPEGHSVKASFAGTLEKNGVDTEAAAEALAGNTGAKIITDYNGNPVLSAYVPVDVLGTTWALLAEIDQAEAFAPIETMTANTAAAKRSLLTRVTIALFITIGVIAALAMLVASTIARPVQEAAQFAKSIAAGDLTKRLDFDQKDEIGSLGRALDNMMENLRKVMRDITDNAETLASSSTDLSATAMQLATGAEESTKRSSTVASAAEQMSANMDNMASSSEEMTTNIKTVASAVEEMTASIGEIARNAEQASSVAANAAQQVETSNDNISELGSAADEIGKVIETIQDIAEQTNLLALNATIEAARAGDAGKGFAVVATEVKELAKQTADATEDIRGRIESIQSSTGRAVQSIGQISEVIQQVNDFSKTIASAVEEQSITTKEIAQNVTQTSDAAATVSIGVNESASASREISGNVTGIDQATRQTAQGASRTQSAGTQMLEMAGQLQQLVGQFKTDTKQFRAGPVKAAHLGWKVRLNDLLSGKQSFQAEDVSDHTQCDFGKWYFGDGKRQFGNIDVFQAIDPKHGEIHALAREITRLHNEGLHNEATRKLRTFEKLTEELFDLLDQLEELANREPANA